MPKKDGGMRPVINLKPFNKSCLDPPHFHMEGVPVVVRLLIPGDWVAFINLKDAFFHIRIFLELCKLLRAMGIHMIILLDDILVIGSTEEECWVNVAMALKVLVEAGFMINHKKSNLIPSQRFQYLGLIWDSTLGQVSLPLYGFRLSVPWRFRSSPLHVLPAAASCGSWAWCQPRSQPCSSSTSRADSFRGL